MKKTSKKKRKRRTRYSSQAKPGSGIAPCLVEKLESRIALTGSPLSIDINPAGASQPSEFVQVGDTTFFVASDDVTGRELWVSDGSVAGTSRVADIFPGAASSSPRGLTEFNGSVMFAANDGINGEELWISDGTSAGTQLVRDIFPGSTDDGPQDSSPRELVQLNGNVFFRAESADGVELWITDGTEAGTLQVLDISPGSSTDGGNTVPDSSNPSELVVANGQLFFAADDGTTGRELWKSDGTATGTTLVRDIFAGSQANASTPIELTVLDDEVYFAAQNAENGAELWKSDGTEAGTLLVKDINGGSADGLSATNAMTAANGVIFFAATDGTSGFELWSTDGTEAGTQLVRDIQPGAGDSLAQVEFANVGNTLYFAADNGLDGPELWKTDGTAAGTVLVANINDANGTGSAPSFLTAVGDRVFFSAEDSASGRELWESDGTAAGTLLVADLAAGSQSSEPVELFDLDGTLFFGADDGSGFDLFTVDTNADPISAPTAIDLLPASDTGSLDDDDITLLTNANADAALTFSIDGVINGAEVRLFNGDVLIGTATAFDTSATVTTNGLFALAEGLQTLQATQLVNGSESPRSVGLDITIDSVPPAAIPSDAPTTVQLGQTYSFDADSPDEGAAGVMYSLISAPNGMTIDAQTGQVSWTPVGSTAEPQTFSIVLSDTAGNSTSKEVDVTVLAEIPALPDTYTVAEDDTLNVTAEAGVLANDGAATLTAAVVTSPANGTLTLDANGSFTYEPNANFNGEDSFTYRASDGTDESNVATVTIDVTPENDAPTVVEDTALALEDTALTVDVEQGVLANDSDVDGDTLTATLATQATNGTVVLNSDGSFVYTPDPDFTGDDLFFYTASDGTITSDPVEVGVRVAPEQDLPTAAADAYTLDEDTVFTVDAATGVLANDVDPDSEDLTASVVDEPANGTLILNDDGSFTYTPAADFSGEDTFTYTASDGTADSTPATVTLTVTNIADAPLAADDTFTAASDGSARNLDVLANDEDADGTNTLTITSVTTGSNGGTITIEGDQLRYSAATGFVGAETFEYTIEDSDGTASTATVTVNVADATVDNTVSGFVYVDHDGDSTRGNNEAGVPGSQLTLSGEDTAGASVSFTTLTLNDGSYQFDNVPAGTYTLTQTQPQALVDGSSSTNDSGATVDGNVISNLSVTGDSAGNNFGESGLRAVYHSIVWFFAKQRAPQSSGDIFREMVAIGEEDAGNDELAQAIRNGEVGDGVGTPGDGTTPVANADNYSTAVEQLLTVTANDGVLANDTDPNGDPLTAAVVTTTGNGTLTLQDDGSFTYQPNSGFTGNDTFTYTATDGTNTSAAATVTITVQDDTANTAPVAVTESYSVDEDQTLTIDTVGGVLSNDTDVDGDNLTSSVRTTASNGTLNLAADGSFSYTPAADFNGQDTFTYVANDGTTDSNEVTVVITVNAVNDAPEAVDDLFNVNEDGSLSRTAAGGVLANDSDAEDSELTVSLIDGPTSGSLTLNADGSFVFTPTADFHGDATFTYEVTDSEGLTDQATVTITVAPVNDAPEAANDTYTIDEDTTLAVDILMSVLANDTDADDDSLTATLVNDVNNGTLTLNADGTFSYVPDADYAGIDTFTYTANDGTQTSNVGAVTINITEIDDPGRIILPVEFSNPNQVPTRKVGEEFTVDVDVEDIDDDDYGFQLDLEASGIPSNAAMPVIDPGTGEITWIPTATGRFAIRVIVVNGDREADQETFLVDILASDVDTGA